MSDAVLRDLEQTVEDFTVPLRMGEGFDETQYSRLCDALRACARAWRTHDSIPKVAANIFVALVPAVAACSSFYEASHEPAVIKRIEQASGELDDLVLQCVAV